MNYFIPNLVEAFLLPLFEEIFYIDRHQMYIHWFKENYNGVKPEIVLNINIHNDAVLNITALYRPTKYTGIWVLMADYNIQ